MSLPASWVDRIFEKLTLTYGQAFLRRWSDIDLNAVKSDWGHELAGFDQHPKAIAWALHNLPADGPPTVLQFKFLARRAPPDELPRLETPKADPSRIAEELAKLEPIKRAPRMAPNTDWARRIVERAESGGRIPYLPLKMAREVLAKVERRP
jgi:hypothetical protein